MRVTIEYNDDERHLVKWALMKLCVILNPNNTDPINYKHKVTVSNVRIFGNMRFDPKELIQKEIQEGYDWRDSSYILFKADLDKRRK